MLKERLSKISTKVFYIAFAVIVSVALWFYVEITENSVQRNEVREIEIVYRNEDVLRNKGMLIASRVTEYITLTFEGPRSDMSKLAAPGAVTVEVDLANILSVGPVALNYDIILPQTINSSAVKIIGSSASRITLIVDRILERPVQVRVNYTGGTASDELIAESPEFDPQMISVRGPEEIISRIYYVYVPIIIENLSTTYTDDLEFLLFDENGEELDSSLRDSIEFSQETIRVTIPVREVKDIPLDVILSHGTGTSDANTAYRITPEVIKLSGDPEVIHDINVIILGTIDMLSFGLTNTEEFRIIIPEYLTNISGETVATVVVDVLGFDTAFRSTSNLQTINTPPGYRAEILTQSLDIRIRGREEDLALVSPINIRVVADLTDMGTGTMTVPAKVYIDGIEADIDAVAVGGEYKITVTIVAE